MLRLIAFLTLSSGYGHADLINFTLTNLCTSNFTNCTTTGCMGSIKPNTTLCEQEFGSCMLSIKADTKRPSACYQTDAAQEAFNYAFYVTLGIFSFLIVGVPVAYVSMEMLSKKFKTCSAILASFSVTPVTAVVINSNSGVNIDNPGQVIGSRIFGSISTTLMTLFSFVTVGWIFTLWQAWTIAQANCDYYEAL